MCKFARPFVVLQVVRNHIQFIALVISQTTSNDLVATIQSTYLRMLGMRRIIRILRLLRNNRWVELIAARRVSSIYVLRGLAVGLLHAVRTLAHQKSANVVHGLREVAPGSIDIVAGRGRLRKRGTRAPFELCRANG
jgi:hypothetical protein